MLNKEDIEQKLKEENFQQGYQLHLFRSIDSTNRYLKDLPFSSNVEVCCSEEQTHGRGRFARQWYSPFGENIYCSSRWTFNGDLSKLSGLSLVVSLAVVETLNAFNINDYIHIKWPNDLLWKGKKLCGNLIEIITETNNNTMLIIGIGLNVNTLPTTTNPVIDKPWSSLLEITGEFYNRNLLIGLLLSTLSEMLPRFLKEGFEAFLDHWHHYDYLINKTITVSQPTGQISGVARGVNKTGQLILEDGNHKFHFLSSGDTSLQLA